MVEAGDRDGMNERQFRQIVQNCGPKGLVPLFGGQHARIVLKAAARSVRKCKAAQRVLEKELAPALTAGCELGVARGGTLELQARDGLIFAELCRLQKRLEARVRRAVPGVRRLIVRPAGWNPPADDEASNDAANGGSEALTE